jgi:hypothetical protein
MDRHIRDNYGLPVIVALNRWQRHRASSDDQEALGRAGRRTEPALPSVSPANIALRPSEPAVAAPVAPVTQNSSRTQSHSVLGRGADLAGRRTSRPRDAPPEDEGNQLADEGCRQNESDELLEQFHAYHMQHGIVTLADLRRSYDSLFHKLHSLLQDPDPPLARDIDRSRAAIWEVLADPRKFSASVMAGA